VLFSLAKCFSEQDLETLKLSTEFAAAFAKITTLDEVAAVVELWRPVA